MYRNCDWINRDWTGGDCPKVEWINHFQRGLCEYLSNWPGGKRVYRTRDLQTSPRSQFIGRAAEPEVLWIPVASLGCFPQTIMAKQEPHEGVKGDSLLQGWVFCVLAIILGDTSGHVSIIPPFCRQRIRVDSCKMWGEGPDDQYSFVSCLIF